MIGQKWNSEIHTFKEGKTGRTIQQLTTTGNNVHLYFTENSFDLHKNEIVFLSDRASGQDCAPHERAPYNIFRMNLDTGEIVQLTDEPWHDPNNHAGLVGRATKTPDSRIVVYIAGNKIKKLDAETGEVSVIYEETGSVDDLVLIDISGKKAKLEVLCNHKTSWHTQRAHCHPTWSWDSSRILYASDYGGKVNLYLIRP